MSAARAQRIAADAAAVRQLGAALDLPRVEPGLLGASHHTVFAVGRDIVARVQSTDPPETAWPRAEKEIRVALHLAARGAPAPLPFGALAGPHRIDAAVVTLWERLAEARPATERYGSAAAGALIRLHAALRDYSGPLPTIVDALDRCRSALEASRPGAFGDADRRFLLEQLVSGRERMARIAPSRFVPIHGDAHLGNMVVTRDGPVWLDLGDVCRGPREYDIAALPATIWRRFERVDRGILATCSLLRSVCIATWCMPGGDERAREAAAFHLDRAKRLTRRDR